MRQHHRWLIGSALLLPTGAQPPLMAEAQGCRKCARRGQSCFPQELKFHLQVAAQGCMWGERSAAASVLSEAGEPAAPEGAEAAKRTGLQEGCLICSGTTGK